MKTSFLDQERECELLFASSGPFFHLCTDGTKQEIIFSSKEIYKIGMNCVAIAYNASRVQILAFVLMSNHVHFILQGNREDCLNFFQTFKSKLRRQIPTIQDSFNCDEPIPITDIGMLRTEIVYVIRNPYVCRRDILPHTYPCGTGSLMFNKISQNVSSIPFNGLTYAQKREIIRGRIFAPETNFLCSNGMILPISYCAIELAEGVFRDASHYYSELNKKVEAYSQVAKRLGDSMFMNDEELFSAIRTICKEEFNTMSIRSLSGKDKLSLLKAIKAKFNTGNAQLSRILSIDRSFVDQLFPS